MGISISFENDTSLSFSVVITTSGIPVGTSGIIKPGTTWTKTDNGLSASMTYTAKIEDKSSPLIFTGKKYETRKWNYPVQAPAIKGNRVYKISDVIKADPMSQSRRSLPRVGLQSGCDLKIDGNDKSTKFDEIEAKLMAEIKLEEDYWGGQEIGVSALVNRVCTSLETFKGLEAAVAAEDKHALSHAKALTRINSLAAAETGSLRLAGKEMSRIRARESKLLTKLSKEVLRPGVRTLGKCGAQQAKMKTEIATHVQKLSANVMKQRDMCLKAFTTYRNEKEDPNGKGDPLIALRTYFAATDSLHKSQGPYASAVSVVAKRVRELDIQRVRETKATLLSVLRAKREHHLQCAQATEAALKALESVNPEADFQEFGHELHWMGPSDMTKDIMFDPKPFGMEFIGRKVTKVAPGSQAEAKGVIAGWQIIRIDGRISPADHKVTTRILRKLKEAGKPILIRFGKEHGKPELFYQQAPRSRDAKINANIEAHETECKGKMQYLISGMMGGWREHYGILSKKGNLHIFRDSKTPRPAITIILNRCTYKLTTDGIIELTETQPGMFSSSEQVHKMKATDPKIWLPPISKFMAKQPTSKSEPKVPAPVIPKQSLEPSKAPQAVPKPSEGRPTEAPQAVPKPSEGPTEIED